MDTKTDDGEARRTAEEHLKLMFSEEGSKPCDASAPDDKDVQLPPWFDEEKFQRGQRYYQDNAYGMFLGKLCGLLVVLAVPTILRILMFTQRSSTSFTAYKRYVATLLHTTLWYDFRLTRDSSSWRSLMQVRKRHFAAGEAACSRGIGCISQRDMALTQFGFMGFILVRPRLLGVRCLDREDREAFVHLWRCLGHVLGIEDRFNICRGSLEETEELCELIIHRVFRPYLAVEYKDFDHMAKALLDGMWCFNPFIEYNCFMYFTKRLLNLDNYNFPLPIQERIVNNNENKPGKDARKISKRIVKEMHWYSRSLLFFMIYLFEVLFQYNILRLYFNSLIRMSLFLIKNFPFLAFYQYNAYQSCFVDIHVDDSKLKNT